MKEATAIREAYRLWTEEKQTPPEILRPPVLQILAALDAGKIRVAEPPTTTQGTWTTHAWIKEALLLGFYYLPCQAGSDGARAYYDRWPLKAAGFWAQERGASRITPTATVRYSAYLGSECVLMPCFVNIGAHIGDRTMIDTWATVGSCAQIGSRVHLGGGAGIGGVLEPPQSQPTIIEDDVFIGARSEVVEGLRIGHGSVLAMGTFLGQSTRIYDRVHDRWLRGQVPPYSVVVPGSYPSQGDGVHLSCAVIVKYVDAQTRKKTTINELLREATAAVEPVVRDEHCR